eukprot:jgi/Ulvmu1/10476/UM064_0013.1
MHTEVRLACVQKRATLVAKEAELGRLLKLPAESQPPYVREFDRRASRANTERLGLRLGNSLNYCLFTQGPLCAAVLLKAYLGSWATAGVLRQLGSGRPDPFSPPAMKLTLTRALAPTAKLVRAAAPLLPPPPTTHQTRRRTRARRSDRAATAATRRSHCRP